MQRSVVFGIIGLLTGALLGFFAANTLNKQNTANTSAIDLSANPAAASNSVVNLGGMQPDISATLEKAEADPQNFAAQMKAGDMYAQISRYDKAVEFYKRGILINPANFQANVVLANALFDSQKFEEAEGYYAKALQINPNDLNARTDMGATFVERSNPNYDRAISEFKKALETQPNHAPTLYYLGIANLRKGDKDASKKYLAELEKAHPGNDLTGKLKQNIEAN